VKAFLFRHRVCLAGGLIIASLINCFVRHNGDWGRFFTILITQLWFAQGVINYLFNGSIVIAPWGLDKNANPEWRALLAGFAFFLYVVVFFLSF
jgi:hypothetical protein